MKKRNTVKAVAAFVGVCCAMTSLAFGRTEDNVNAEIPTAVGESVFVDTPAPYTMYYCYGTLGLSKGSSKVYVNVETVAFQKVNHVYHDITIYKNGTWVSSKRYDAYNSNDVTTSISVPAVSGDRIEVYVDHYTEHGGVVEGGHSSKALVY